MRTGYVPKNVTVITRKKSEKVSSWRFEYLDEDVAELEVYKTIVVGDQAKEKTLENAREWAGRDGQFNETVEPNEPRQYHVVNLEIRSEGGRAWKVLDDQKRYYDLREDSLLYSLMDLGCDPNGKLRNKMVWGVCDNTIKLIPVDSAIYFALLQAQERRETKPIKKSDLKPGYLYRTKSDSLFIFCGTVNKLDIQHTKSYSYWNTNNNLERIQEKLNQQLWMSVYSGRYADTDKTELDNAKETFKENDYFRYDVVVDKKVIEEIGYVGEANINHAIAAHKKENRPYNFIESERKPIKSYLEHFDHETQQQMVYAQTVGRYYV